MKEVELGRSTVMSMQGRALATIGTGPHANFLAYSGETFRRYALKHGYEYIQGSGSLPEPRPPAWAKIPLLRQLLESFEMVVWIDADAIILDHSRDIASELEDGAWQAMVAHRYDGHWMPNTGVWVLRSGARSGDFLRAVWNSVDFIDHGYWDNAAVMHLLGFTVENPMRLVDPDASWLEGTQWLPDEWNRLTRPTRTLEPARIRHLAGEYNTVRTRQMRADLAALDGKRIRPMLARVEWALRRAGLDGRRIRPALIRLVTSMNERRSRHPLWYPYLAYRAVKNALRRGK